MIFSDWIKASRARHRWHGIGWLLAAVLLAPTFSHADDGLVLLQRMAQAASQLTYSGVFVYQSGRRMESSRIAHACIDGRDRERIEMLDGSPREIIRNGDEIQRFIPDQNRLIIETRATHRRFPALLPTGLVNLPDYYRIRWKGYGRVAGFDSRVLALEPRDGLRYGWQFWIDTDSGLLLRSRIVNENDEQLESFSFTQLKIGDPLPVDALEPSFDSRQVQQVRRISATETSPENQGWIFRTTLPGFQRIAALKRETGDGRPESLHILFSDGVASISVFIEAHATDAQGTEPPLLSSMGPVNVYHRRVHDHVLVVMGEVPPLAVKQLGDGVEWKGK
jgi:sigma-E factor negative regulatory protein RseB